MSVYAKKDQTLFSYVPGMWSDDGEEDDNEQLYCGEESGRCIHRSVACDNLGSDNCGDGTDQSQHTPALCGQGKHIL